MQFHPFVHTLLLYRRYTFILYIHFSTEIKDKKTIIDSVTLNLVSIKSM